MSVDQQREKGKRKLFERLFSSKPDDATEEEILELVSMASELEGEEKRMIANIIDLGDTTAGEICTPRVDVMLVQDTETALSAIERMRGTGYSRLPVYHDDIDDIVGIANYKDLIGALLEDSGDDPVEKYMYKAMFVPETKFVIPLLGEMQASHYQMVILVDEYGGMDGIVTVEDILEEIVGEIGDESDVGSDLILQLSDNAWRVDGRFPIAEAESLGWPVKESDDYETIAGWFLNEIDSVPKPGDSIEVDGYRFTVVRMRRSRISQIKVEKL